MKVLGIRNTSYSENLTYNTSSNNIDLSQVEELSDGFFFGIDSVMSDNKMMRPIKLPPSAITGKYDQKKPPSF
jgi:hypothetical protein